MYLASRGERLERGWLLSAPLCYGPSALFARIVNCANAPTVALQERPVAYLWVCAAGENEGVRSGWRRLVLAAAVLSTAMCCAAAVLLC